MTARHLLHRLLQSLLTLLAVSFLVYALIGLMPGDPIDLMAAGNPRMTPEDATRLRALYGLDQPLLARYGHWLLAALGGDLGYSRLFGLPVGEVLLPRLLSTVLLVGSALALTVILAVPLAVYAAQRPGSPADRFINAASLAGMSVPAFWLGLMLISLFSVKLGWLPASAGEGLFSALMPIATLMLAGLAVYVRHIRALMIEALQSSHVRTARAKGCSKARTVWNHAFGSALPAALTLLMLDIGAIFSGAITVETVFAWPGMGKLMFDAVMGNDYNLALIGFLILTATVLAANIVADTAYALLDPRVKPGAAG